MKTAELTPHLPNDGPGRQWMRQLSDQAFSRASGTPLRQGNAVQLLKDATEHYPAWLEAIQGAQRTVHLEMYIFAEDPEGERFATALLERARQGVRVRVLQDWFGALGRTSRQFWARLRDGGVEVRVYNPFRFDRPLGWVSRNHRKVLSVDHQVAFITGLCIAQEWAGDPARGLPPWRDTGVALRGPAVTDVEDAFAEAWATAGDPLPLEPPGAGEASTAAGDVAVRVVATVPNTAGLFRVDQLVAALAQKTLWLTDAYFTATPPYVQALRAAAGDGVDVRLLVPGASDLPLLQPLARSGYRPLLEAGVRVFEWNGPMVHAKTAVADSRWARVGSTNLNLASWVGNRELDVIVENAGFAEQMEAMYLADLGNATEVVLERKRLRAPGAPQRPRDRRAGISGGSRGRVVAGAARLGDTVSAAITSRRVLEPTETRVTLLAAALLLLVAGLGVIYPRVLAYPLAGIAAWLAVALVSRGISLRWERRRRKAKPPQASRDSAGGCPRE